MKKAYKDILEEYNGLYLYKRNLEGKVIYWMAKLEDFGEYVCKVYHGHVHHDFKSDAVKNVINGFEPTNVGKSNETTSEEQAIKELKSLYLDKLKKGYDRYDRFIPETVSRNSLVGVLEDIVAKTNTDASGFSKPMKCQPFQLGKVKYPAYAQPKYNGVRATICRDKFSKDLFNDTPILILSKEGVKYELKHLYKQFDVILNRLENMGIDNPILDGEVYLPNTPVTTIGGAARNSKNPIHPKLQFVIFDLSIENYTQVERLHFVDAILGCTDVNIQSNNFTNPRVYVSRRIQVNNDEQALEYLDECLKYGYEGCVVREFEPEYAFGQRPKTIRKLKKFEDAEFEIIDIVPYGNGLSNVGTGCKFILRNDSNDLVFESVPLGTTQERLEMLKNKEVLIGKQATAKFYERTINDIPFHSNVISIRDYEK